MQRATWKGKGCWRGGDGRDCWLRHRSSARARASRAERLHAKKQLFREGDLNDMFLPQLPGTSSMPDRICSPAAAAGYGRSSHSSLGADYMASRAAFRLSSADDTAASPSDVDVLSALAAVSSAAAAAGAAGEVNCMPVAVPFSPGACGGLTAPLAAPDTIMPELLAALQAPYSQADVTSCNSPLLQSGTNAAALHHQDQQLIYDCCPGARWTPAAQTTTAGGSEQPLRQGACPQPQWVHWPGGSNSLPGTGSNTN